MRISASSLLPASAASTENLRPTQQAEVFAERQKAQAIAAESTTAENHHTENATASRVKNEAKVEESKDDARHNAPTIAQQWTNEVHHRENRGVGLQLNAKA